ncbi:MAG: hypothetical protein U0324_20635 [Polyangiales bacterium]
MRNAPLLLGLPLLLVACADPAPTRFTSPDGAAPADVAGDAGTPPGFDVDRDARPVDAPDVPTRFTACDKVDLLFVIDDSGSMDDNQRSLAASFDGFIRGVRARLAGVQSYHIGVVTSEDYRANAPGCTGIGNLVTRTGGPNASNMNCGPFASGAAYLTEAEPDLAGKFRCVAQLGSGGDDNERMARGMLNAVDPANNAPGRCNAGFARRDSLLVIVLITDEDDVPTPCDTFGCTPGGSGGSGPEWLAELVRHRNGTQQNIVVLSLLGRRPDNTCGAQVAARLVGFTNRFGANGFIGDICADRYDAFFESTLGVIQSACANYVAPP